jgi:uncharacterized membrane protein YgaE (UPF0421/DUF939 family)
MRDLFDAISLIMGIVTMIAMVVAVFLGDKESATLFGVIALILRPSDK